MVIFSYLGDSMKEQTVSDNHNNGGKRSIYSHPEVSEFADTLHSELAKRAESLRHNAAVDGCYRSVAFDITQITASALSDWVDRHGTTRELGNIIARLWLALVRMDIAMGLCSNRTHWKPPTKTMQILAGFNEKS